SKRAPYWNRYRNAVRFDDVEVEKVLSALKAAHLLKNTVVMITADHGEQLNDYHRGVWSHGGAYTDYQLHVPMLVYWPGKRPNKLYYRTSHYDVVPTLMQSILGCGNPVSDYALGASLFTENNRPYMIAGSYTDYSVVQSDRVMRIYPDGDYAIDYPNGKSIPYAVPNINVLRHVYANLTKYFKSK
nr:sulfatase-like hydrolase/transferase [Gammaproteobacteria bacterium]